MQLVIDGHAVHPPNIQIYIRIRRMFWRSREKSSDWIENRQMCQDKGIQKLDCGFKYFFYVHPYLGKWSNFTNIFQRGWNHQPDKGFGIEFKSPDLRNILVATDVAARGLDLKHVSVVVSYNPAVPVLNMAIFLAKGSWSQSKKANSSRKLLKLYIDIFHIQNSHM